MFSPVNSTISLSSAGGTFITVFYEQKASCSSPVKILLIAVLLLILVFYAFSVSGLFGLGTDPEESFMLLPVLILYLAAMQSFFGMKFVITRDSIVAFSPPFKYRIPFSEIISIETLEKIPWYVGWGLRIWGRKLLFAGAHGKAVLIRKENGFFRTVVLVPENPDEFRRRLEQAVQ